MQHNNNSPNYQPLKDNTVGVEVAENSFTKNSHSNLFCYVDCK